MTKIMAGAKTAPGKGHFELIEVEKPVIREDTDVLIRVTSVGMCGTDVSIYQWKESVAVEYHPEFPLVIGHEMAGIVEEVGPAVTRFKPGDLVTVNEHIFCDDCEQCREGRTCICQNRVILGCHVDGAMREYIAVREKNCFKLPDNIPPYAGSIAEPLSVSLHAAERLPARRGDTVVVSGVGTIGLGMCLVLRRQGVNVIALGLPSDAKRLALAGELGAVPVCITEESGLAPVFDKLAQLGRRYADAAYECSGSGAGLRNALELIKPAGAVAEVGIPGKEIPIDISGQIVFKEKTIVGCRAFYHSTWDKTMELLRDCGEQAEKLITHRLDLKDFAKGIDLITSGECLKVVVCPSKE